jgi:RHS repeat-associated protein
MRGVYDMKKQGFFTFDYLEGYINGNPMTNVYYGNSLGVVGSLDNSSHWYFGRDFYNKETFDGNIDDLHFYKRALSVQEVQEIYADNHEAKQKTLHAKYYYYPHGPLKRVELGENLQGIDYVYTINGMLKSINNPNGTDPGKDGVDGEMHAGFAEDVFAMALDYYNGDYYRDSVDFGNDSDADRYDGNIKKQRWKNKKLDDMLGTDLQNTWKYSYDERNYLAMATFGTTNQNDYMLQASAAAYSVFGTGLFQPITYDYNGNILNLMRRDGDGNIMDQFTYNYEDGNTAAINRLSNVHDAADATIDGTQGDLPSQASQNYTYNAIGQLIDDATGQNGEGHLFTYNVYGKVTHIHDATGAIIAEYSYDDRGFRVKKTVTTPTNTKTTWYARDLSGNIIGTYQTVDATPPRLIEMPVYGSGRLGLANASGGIITKYVYELTDHLGNVRTTISNNFSEDDGSSEYDILSATDYYPGGMTMPGRDYTSETYRFGYQGLYAEKDEETGYNQFELRLYDARIGRWLSTDPYGQYHSPYVGMGNDWSNGIDPDGGWKGRRRSFKQSEFNGNGGRVFRQSWRQYKSSGYVGYTLPELGSGPQPLGIDNPYGDYVLQVGGFNIENQTILFEGAVRGTGFGVDRPKFGYHRGIDFTGAPAGTPIYSLSSGEVVKLVNDWKEGGNEGGNRIRIRHANGYEVAYNHLQGGSIPGNLKVGSIINQGDIIGGLGTTGRSTGVHLHLEVWENSSIKSKTDPIDYFPQLLLLPSKK